MASLITNQSHSLTVHLTAGWVTALLNSCSRTENGPLNLFDESRMPREEGKRFVFTTSGDTETNLECIYISGKVLSKGVKDSLHRAEISEQAHAAFCKGQCPNRWHVITLSHSKRACPITRVKSSVQELRLPRHFAWLASPMGLENKDAAGRLSGPLEEWLHWQSVTALSSFQKRHMPHHLTKRCTFNRWERWSQPNKRTFKSLASVSTPNFPLLYAGMRPCPVGLFNGSSSSSQQPPKRTGGAN